MPKLVRSRTVAVADMTPAQVEKALTYLPGYMPLPEFRLYYEGPDAESDDYWVEVQAREKDGLSLRWEGEFAGREWEGVLYEKPRQKAAAARQALRNCISALGIDRTSFDLPVKEAAKDDTGSD